jgi:hypothetical protein
LVKWPRDDAVPFSREDRGVSQASCNMWRIVARVGLRAISFAPIEMMRTNLEKIWD